MRRLLLLLLAVAAGGLLLLQVPAVQTGLVRRVADRRAAEPAPRLAAPNELSVLLCGTGTPLPDPKRAGPCALVAAGDRLFVVDAGIGSVRNLLRWRVPLEQVEGVLVTHFHSDHIAELGELRLQSWVAGRAARLPVYGPPGIEQVVRGVEELYALDTQYRVAHHGAEFLPPAAAPLVARVVDIAEGQTTAPVLSAGGLTITAIRVHHPPATPAYGYRFDYAGRSLVVSGDTTADQDLAAAAKGADLLIHEGLSPELVAIVGEALAAHGRSRPAKILHDIPGYHTAPVEAARIANEAGVRRLVFTHLLPILPNRLAERFFLRGVSDVRSHGVELGHDGLLLRLPGESERIEETTLRD
jgi:ribonuclease Z